MIPAEFLDLLVEPNFATIATVRPNGQPQNSPTWFEWDGEHVKLSCVASRQRPRNIAHEPRVALTVIDPKMPYRYLEVRGFIERIDSDPDHAFINRLAKRYLDLDVFPWDSPGERTVQYLRPTSVATKAAPPKE